MIGCSIAIAMSLLLGAGAPLDRAHLWPKPPLTEAQDPPTTAIDAPGENYSPRDQEWIDAVFAHRASDGHTIKQILSNAEVEKESIFKVQRAEVDYRYSEDKIRVVIYYWLGRGRTDGNLYTDLTFDVHKLDGNFVVTPFTYDALKGMEGTNPAPSAEFGLYSFLGFIDEAYKIDCQNDHQC